MSNFFKVKEFMQKFKQEIKSKPSFPDDNIIKLTGDVSIESPTRLLTGYELIADIDNNKRILNSANDESLVEVLLDNNANN